MNISKIIFIGLPGAGKSSVSTQLAQQYSLHLCSSDVEIKKVLNQPQNNASDLRPLFDEKLAELKKDWIRKGLDSDKVERAYRRDGYEKHSTAFMEILSEPLWREVEATIAAVLINLNPEYMFDLGASQVLNDLVRKALADNGFVLVYLDADEASIEQHLSTPQDNGEPRWQCISNYKQAGDNWRELAKSHRETRAAEYEKMADATIKIHQYMSIDDVIAEVEQLDCIRTMGLNR